MCGKKMIYMIHFLLVAPLLVYIGYNGSNNLPIQPMMYQLVLGLGLLAGAYHLYKFLNFRESMSMLSESEETIVPIRH
jgi:hypothetical protein